MKLIKRLCPDVFILIILIMLVNIYGNSHKDYYGSDDLYIYSKGNSPDAVRTEIIGQLKIFQDGYTKRDLSHVDAYMEKLFSKENVVILGTMPKEIYVGYDQAKDLVYTDWQSWGDCRFLVNTSNVSSSGEVAWFSTIGNVKFDISRFLVLPLRLTGTMVKENETWKFRQLQFQFDLNLMFLLLIQFLLIVWLVVRLIIYIITGIRAGFKTR